MATFALATQRPMELRGARRNNPPPVALTDAIAYAVGRTYGPGYSFQVRSGIVNEPKGRSGASSSGRHIMDGPGAADVRIFDPQGNQLAGASLTPLAQNWVSNFGSIGVNRKASETDARGWTHMDLVYDQGRGQEATWDYGGWAEKGQRDAILSYKRSGKWVDGQPADDIATAIAENVKATREASVRNAPPRSGILVSLFGRGDLGAVEKAQQPSGDPAVMQIQTYLAQNGFDPGEANGVMSEKTMRALNSYNASADPEGDMMARVMLAEARGEGPAGMAAVGWVARNRTLDQSGLWPKDIGGVLGQKGQFAPPLRDVDPAAYAEAFSIAAKVRSAPPEQDPTGGATYFKTDAVNPAWASAEPFRGKIGNHEFYGQVRTEAAPQLAYADAVDAMDEPAAAQQAIDDMLTGQSADQVLAGGPRTNPRDGAPASAPIAPDMGSMRSATDVLEAGPRLDPRRSIASAPVGPTTDQGVLDMGPNLRPGVGTFDWTGGGAPDAGAVPDPNLSSRAQAMAAALGVDMPTPPKRPGNFEYLGGGAPDTPPTPRSNPRRDPFGFPIDVTRPALANGDGSISTEETTTFDAAEVGMPPEIVTVPTIINGRRVSEDEAKAAFAAGANAAVQRGFANYADAEAAAQARTNAIPDARATAPGRFASSFPPRPEATAGGMPAASRSGDLSAAMGAMPPDLTPASQPVSTDPSFGVGYRTARDAERRAIEQDARMAEFDAGMESDSLARDLYARRREMEGYVPDYRSPPADQEMGDRFDSVVGPRSSPRQTTTERVLSILNPPDTQGIELYRPNTRTALASVLAEQEPYSAQRQGSSADALAGVEPPPGWEPGGQQAQQSAAFRPPQDSAFEWFNGYSRGYTGEGGAFSNAMADVLDDGAPSMAARVGGPRDMAGDNGTYDTGTWDVAPSREIIGRAQGWWEPQERPEFAGIPQGDSDWSPTNANAALAGALDGEDGDPSPGEAITADAAAKAAAGAGQPLIGSWAVMGASPPRIDAGAYHPGAMVLNAPGATIAERPVGGGDMQFAQPSAGPTAAATGQPGGPVTVQAPDLGGDRLSGKSGSLFGIGAGWAGPQWVGDVRSGVGVGPNGEPMGYYTGQTNAMGGTNAVSWQASDGRTVTAYQNNPNFGQSGYTMGYGPKA